MADSARSPRPVVLCILDGWGHREETSNNAIAAARTPVFDRWMSTCPHALVDSSELEVGLPRGQMGNSEVGHMNIGGGRVVLQDLPRIDAAVASGELGDLPGLRSAMDTLKETGGTAHLLGLMSPGGVHAHQDHIAAVSNLFGAAGLPVAVHAFLDGRDTPPRSAVEFVERFERDAPSAPIATVSGRFYAMDRDNRWDRVELAYTALVGGEGESAASALEAVAAGYARGENDEFIVPTVVGSYSGMHDGDVLVMLNFRSDRAREILQALLIPDFVDFERGPAVCFSSALGLCEYSAELSAHLSTLFPPQRVKQSLGEVVSDAGLKQLRIAETEKYAHVTFFLNGGREDLFVGEERMLVPSPAVSTYDLHPEMSAPEVTGRLVEAIESEEFDLIVVNYANGDMVGHTGNFDAAVQAIETVDAGLGRLEAALERVGGCMLVTADHGNAEQMSDPATGQAHTAHTMNPVPLVLVNGPTSGVGLADGRLADIAPTVLTLMGLPKPEAMTGRVLLHAHRSVARA